jgi:hypothetical protein
VLTCGSSTKRYLNRWPDELGDGEIVYFQKRLSGAEAT